MFEFRGECECREGVECCLSRCVFVCEWVVNGFWWGCWSSLGFFFEDPDSCVADMLIAMESRTTRLVFLASF